MQLKILAQPFTSEGETQQFGQTLIDLLDSREPFFDKVWLVSAFADSNSIARLTPHIQASKEKGAEINIVVGIDLQSTSLEALQAILKLDIDAKIVKNTLPFHTFHPKFFVFESSGTQAEVFIGSNNLTNGGLFRNYEAAAWLSFDLTKESEKYDDIINSLARFINPPDSITSSLTEDLLQVLLERGDVVCRNESKSAVSTEAAEEQIDGPPSPFGFESIPSAPSLPAKMREVERSHLEATSILEETPMPENDSATYEIEAFYMQLNKIQTASTPGEVRIPLAGLNAAPEFWGWPDKYNLEIRQRGKKKREYRNWKPMWRIVDTLRRDQTYEGEVRMYIYRQRSEFRFYSKDLVDLGAEEMDIVRITRCADDEAITFQCELAHQGHEQYDEWEKRCNKKMGGNSKRRSGFE